MVTGPTQVLNPNSSSNGAAVFAGLTSVTDRPTDHTTRSVRIGRIYIRSTAMRPKNNKWENRIFNIIVVSYKACINYRSSSSSSCFAFSVSLVIWSSSFSFCNSASSSWAFSASSSASSYRTIITESNCCINKLETAHHHTAYFLNSHFLGEASSASTHRFFYTCSG